MTKEELAGKLDGREYGDEITQAEVEQAKDAGLVVVFGASDDLIEFTGAIHAEAYCHDGTIVLVDHRGLLTRNEIEHGDDEAVAEFVARKKAARKIESLWAEEGYSWIYRTDIPHATFEVIEDEDPYCRGLVFALADLGGGR
jgi:roadblock/LC7 domain-containing protein